MLPSMSLGINGLLDASNAPFPASGAFVLTWIAAHAFVTFEIDVVSEALPFTSPAAWSSGRIASNITAHELPSALTATFVPDSTYKWRVGLHSSALSASPAWSSAATFDVAPTAAALGAATWIGGGSELRTDWALPPSPVVRARAYASGLGSFELFINGNKVGDHIMDPGEAVYDQKALYVGFNVTTMLKADATNAVGARVGNSKYGYLDIYTNRSAASDQSGDSTRAFLLLLVAELADGTKVSMASDAARWKSRHGPIVYDHLWHGEIYDKRQEATLDWSAAPLAAYPAGVWVDAARAMTPTVKALFPQVSLFLFYYLPLHFVRILLAILTRSP